ncbi:MAG: DUF1570 domain-containing protein, partial [Pirellulaceae bacterium]|nr:DUF1570 domain-containing protein [Pirellulaceae bacterium]
MPNLPDSRRNSIRPARALPTTTAVVSVFIALIGLCGGSKADEMIEIAVANQTIEGVPIAWNAQTVRMLGRDGRLWELDPAEVVGFKKTASRFRAYSLSEFRASLLRELGADYEVSGAGRYLVAHPRGQRDRWAERFEQFYRSFVHFFYVRGFAVRQPQFPLVGIVCKDRIDFQALHGGAEAENNRSRGIDGSYNLASNRIAIYDAGGAENSPGRQRNNAVLIHEATHQIAFNTGVHNRYSPPPTWAVEGLALLFEAPGIH